MATLSDAKFKQDYASHLKHLKLKGLQPKTIDAYSRAIRRIGGHFNYQIDSLSELQLTDFFSQLLADGSWSTVKPDLYGARHGYATSGSAPHQTRKRSAGCWLPHVCCRSNLGGFQLCDGPRSKFTFLRCWCRTLGCRPRSGQCFLGNAHLRKSHGCHRVGAVRNRRSTDLRRYGAHATFKPVALQCVPLSRAHAVWLGVGPLSARARCGLTFASPDRHRRASPASAVR